MQAYGEEFALVYNDKWSGFVKRVAPLILDFYESTPEGKANKSVLDLCCGTGQLAVHFLERGYGVVGLDLSEPMLQYARNNAGGYLKSGQGKFVHANASDFTLQKRFGLVVSTYDSLNHLENERALTRCFECVYAVSDGYFIFDLNTQRGLKKRWNGTWVDDSSDDAVIINHGTYDGDSDKAWMKITGFVAESNGTYRRFDETVYNTVYRLARVNEALLGVGFKNVYFARIQDLATPLIEPEEEGRVFVVAKR